MVSKKYLGEHIDVLWADQTALEGVVEELGEKLDKLDEALEDKVYYIEELAERIELLEEANMELLDKLGLYYKDIPESTTLEYVKGRKKK